MASCLSAQEADPRSLHNLFMVSDWLMAYAARPDGAGRRTLVSPAEQREDLLAILIGDAQRLNAKLLLHLKGL